MVLKLLYFSRRCSKASIDQNRRDFEIVISIAELFATFRREKDNVPTETSFVTFFNTMRVMEFFNHHTTITPIFSIKIKTSSMKTNKVIQRVAFDDH